MICSLVGLVMSKWWCKWWCCLW